MGAAGAGLRADEPVSPDDARKILTEILARREFRQTADSSALESLSKRVVEWLEQLTDMIGRSIPGGALISQVFAWIVAIAALVALTYWLFRRRWSRDEPVPLVTNVPRLTSREWIDRLRLALRDGDAREAIRCGYHAALFHLEEQGVWHVDEARTPREYLPLLAPQDARRAAMTSITRDFEMTWYGSRTADVHDLIARLEVCGCRVPSERAI